MPARIDKAAPAKFALRMTATLSKEAKEAAAREGVSLNQFINLAIAEKVEYLANEAWIARPRRPLTQERIDNAVALLNRKGTLPPEPGDEIPEAYQAWERKREQSSRRRAG
jgi:uncharacterized protein (DUF1778 family)